MPGEIFSEIDLAMERTSPVPHAIVVGFSESSIGYVPPKHVFQEGGYEIGPGKWSFLQEQAESTLRDEAEKLLKSMAIAADESRFNRSKSFPDTAHQNLRIPA